VSEAASERERVLGPPPSAAEITTYDELVDRLRALRVWGGMSYRELHRQVVRLRKARGVAELPVYNTVYRCLQPGRALLDDALVADIATALLGDPAPAQAWQRACVAIEQRRSTAAIVAVADGLPDDLAEFTGRVSECAAILEGPDDGTGSTAVVYVLEGMAGVGKTTLAVHVAHALRAAGRFTDLCLSVNLRGFDAELPPADPAALLSGFLRRLGVPAGHVATLTLAHRAALFGKLLAGRRALLLLDNAASVEQVRPLVPSSSSCLVLVTSRRRLEGLPATHLRLEVLRREESVALLRRIAGTERMDADPAAAAGIAELAGHLPLALSLVANRIRSTPDWAPADHLARLAERTDRLRLEDGVQATIGLSYDQLPAGARRLLRLLALHPGRDVDGFAAAALAGCGPGDAEAALATLATTNMLRQRVTGRFELHDVIRMFAASRATDEEPASARRAALTRLLDHYRHSALLAMNHYAPHEAHRLPAVPDRDIPAPGFADRASATAWLDAERVNLVAAAIHAAAHGWPEHTGHLSMILFRYLDLSGHHLDAEILHAAASRTSADALARARALTHLGIAHINLSRFHAARDELTRAADLYRDNGNHQDVFRVLINLGGTELYLGRLAEARRQFRHAASSAEATGDEVALGRAMGNVAVADYLLGHYQDAIETCRQTLTISRRSGDRIVEGAALIHLGASYQRLHRSREALTQLQAGLALVRRVGHRAGEADALNQLGLVHAALGDHHRALDLHDQAMEIATGDGIRELQVQVLNAMGGTQLGLGRPERALGCHRRALTMSRQLDQRYEQARAHDGIGRCLAANGELTAARKHWRNAVSLYTDLGTAEASAVADRLRKSAAGI
jgi:tetratricopeptide (TPR) repeat protein